MNVSNQATDAKEPTILELAESMTKRLLTLEGMLESRLNRSEAKSEGIPGAVDKPQSMIGEIISTMQWNIKKFEELQTRIAYEILNRIG